MTTADVIMLHDAIEVEIPDFCGELHTYTIVWLRPITEEFYEASLRSKDNGFTLWLVRIENSVITPISCTLYLNNKEATLLNLAQSLRMSVQTIQDKVIKERIDVWKRDQIQS